MKDDCRSNYVINIRFLCNISLSTFPLENFRERLRDQIEFFFLILLSVWVILERFYFRFIRVAIEEEFIVCAILFTSS